jgi:hypothetical protein
MEFDEQTQRAINAVNNKKEDLTKFDELILKGKRD